MKTEIGWKYDLLLILTACIWGSAFVAQRIGMRYIGPFFYNGIRFAIGSLFLVPLWIYRAHQTHRNRRSRHSSASLLLGGLAAGAVLFLGASLQQIGIVYTTAGKSGFITGLYVILVPIMGLAWGQKAGWHRWLGAVLAVAGLYLLSVTGVTRISRGDLLVLASAFFWAAHVHVIGWFAPKVDVIALACLQFAVCSILSLAAAIFTETIGLDAVGKAVWPILYGGLLSVGVAYTLQVVAQQKAHPAHTAIILSTEGVFAVLSGWLIIGETLGLRGLIGCALMLAGMIVSQTGTIRGRKK